MEPIPLSRDGMRPGPRPARAETSARSQSSNPSLADGPKRKTSFGFEPKSEPIPPRFIREGAPRMRILLGHCARAKTYSLWRLSGLNGPCRPMWGRLSSGSPISERSGCPASPPTTSAKDTLKYADFSARTQAWDAHSTQALPTFAQTRRRPGPVLCPVPFQVSRFLGDVLARLHRTRRNFFT